MIECKLLHTLGSVRFLSVCYSAYWAMVNILYRIENEMFNNQFLHLGHKAYLTAKLFSGSQWGRELIKRRNIYL